MSNRTIKFRVWDETINKFLENGEGLCLEEMYGGFGGQTVSQQFTGLLDKNGKEVYEGDILKTFGARYSIEYNSEIAGFSLVEGKRSLGHIGALNSRRDWFEIIGNIFENPDLLS